MAGRVNCNKLTRPLHSTNGADWQQHVQNHKVQRLDIAEVARLARDNEQGSSQDSKLNSEDDKPKLDRSSNQTAGAAHYFCVCLLQKLCSGMRCCEQGASLLHCQEVCC